MDYPVETFTDEERALLAPHFTNLDRPVFALVNLPETVKGALFARYSRYQGTLRRLYLDEFAENAAHGSGQDLSPFDGEEGERARKLYERIFIGYGDDSVAQLGGAHIACEWVSNVMTKLLQRGRLAAYLEQSTRYMPYDVPIGDGLGYRYWRHAELGPEYEAAMDFLFESYSEALPRVEAWAAERFPRADDEPEAAHARSIRAKALDLLRGLLPAASLSHVGIFASGQAYEQLLLRLFASPLPEARDYASMILEELKAVVPSFVARVERPDRGGEWISYLEEREQAGERWAARLGLDRATRDEETGPAVRLLSVQGSEEELLAALLFEAAAVSEDETRAALRNLPPDERAAMLAELVGERAQPPPPPRPRLRGAPLPVRGGVRLRRVPRPAAPPAAHRPVADARAGARAPACRTSSTRRASATSTAPGLERSRDEYARIADAGHPELAHYALALGYRIRYVLDMNAREAMHLIELRSGREGHPAYRAVAHALHAEIARVHPAVAATMTFVDRDTEPRLERILSEIRAHAKQAARA